MRSILCVSCLAGLVGLPMASAGQTTTEVHPGRGGSPHVTTTRTIDGATLTITYGRPYVKGRTIFGDLLPYGQVWRTGADEATTLETSATLEMGGIEIPEGTYTLYTLPGETSWMLIINTETGQWGTEYFEEDDLARIDMERETLSRPVEQLTIRVIPERAPRARLPLPTTESTTAEATATTPAALGGLLQVEWEATRVSVPFTVKTKD